MNVDCRGAAVGVSAAPEVRVRFVVKFYGWREAGGSVEVGIVK